MSTEVRNLYVALSTNVASFRGQMVAAGSSVRGFGSDVAQAGRDHEQFNRGVSRAATAVGVGLVGALAAGIYWNVQLEKAMLNVATISDEVGRNLDFYSDKIRDMAAELPQTTAQLAEGFYDIVSSGYDGADALSILETSAMSASAGMTDTAVAAKATLTVLNAYGLGAQDASDVSDILFQAVNKGIMTYEELAGSIGKVVPTAAAASVEFDEVAAALATITLNGITADEASTSLNQTIAKILVPGAKLEGVFHDLGYESGLASLEANGLKGTIDLLAKSQGRAADTAFQLFPEIRAARGYMALTSNEGKNYARTFESIADEVQRAEAAQRAYQTQSESDAASMERTIGNIQSFAMGLAEILMPVVSAATNGIETFTDMLGAIPDPVKGALGVLGLLVGATALVAGGFLKAQKNIALFKVGLTTLTGTSRVASLAVTGLKLSLGFLGIALVAATAIYGAYTAGKEKAKQATDDFVTALKAEQNGVENAVLTDIAKKLVEDGTIDKLQDVGITTTEAIRGIIGSEKEWKAVQDDLHQAMVSEYPEGYQKVLEAEELAKQQYEDGTITLEEYQAAMVNHGRAMAPYVYQLEDVQNKYGEIEQKLSDYRNGLIDAREIVELLNDTEDKAAKAAIKFADGLTKLENRFAPVVDGERQMSQEAKNLQETLGGMADPMNAFNAAMKDGEVSLDRFIRKLQNQIRDMHEYVDNLALLAAQGRTALVDQFVAMGPEAAGLVAQAVDASDKELNRLERLMGASATYSTVAFQQGLQALPLIASDTGKATVKSLSKAFTGGAQDEAVAMLQVLRDAIQDLPLKHKIDLILDAHGNPAKVARDTRREFNLLPQEVRTNLVAEGFPKTWAQVDELQKKYGLTDEEILTILSARDDASTVIDKVTGKIKAADGDTATTNINVRDNATRMIDYVGTRLTNLNGRSATVTIEERHIRTGVASGYGPQAGDGEGALPKTTTKDSTTGTKMGKEYVPGGSGSTTTIVQKMSAPTIGTLSVPAVPGASEADVNRTVSAVVREVSLAQRSGRWTQNEEG